MRSEAKGHAEVALLEEVGANREVGGDPRREPALHGKLRAHKGGNLGGHRVADAVAEARFDVDNGRAHAALQLAHHAPLAKARRIPRYDFYFHLHRETRAHAKPRVGNLRCSIAAAAGDAGAKTNVCLAKEDMKIKAAADEFCAGGRARESWIVVVVMRVAIVSRGAVKLHVGKREALMNKTQAKANARLFGSVPAVAKLAAFGASDGLGGLLAGGCGVAAA